MSSVNKVILLGRLGKDVEMRSTTNGRNVSKLVVATSQSFKNKAGERQEKTEWSTVIFWGKQAEIASEYLRKGDQIYLEGRMETRKYEKDGQDQYVTEVIGESFTMLGGNNKGGGNGDNAKAPAKGKSPAPAPGAEDEDMIPF